MEKEKKSKWTNKQTEKLIELFEQYPNLYDVKSEEFRSRIRRESALREITEKLKDHVEGVTIEKVRNRIHGIRCQYNREKGAQQKSRKSGTGVDSPKLWCFNQLSFLDVSIRERQSSTTLHKDKLDNTPDSLPSTTLPLNATTGSSLRREQKMRVEGHPKYCAICFRYGNKLKKRNDRTYDEYFAKFIAKEMEKIIDDEILSETKLKIHSLINEAVKECKIKSESTVSSGSLEYNIDESGETSDCKTGLLYP